MDYMISQHEPDDIKNVVWNSILYLCLFSLFPTNGNQWTVVTRYKFRSGLVLMLMMFRTGLVLMLMMFRTGLDDVQDRSSIDELTMFRTGLVYVK